MRSFMLALLPVLLVSCFEPDERVFPFPGNTTTITDSVQTNQSWFDLESGTVISSNSLTDWDMAFESDPSGWRVVINSGADWFIYNTGSDNFSTNVGMPSQIQGLYDIKELWPDSTATGDWRKHGHVYVFARYANGRFTDHKRIRFINYTADSYLFYYEDSLLTDSVRISKDTATVFSYYSFTQKAQVFPEPNKSEYDLEFTSYYNLATLFGQTLPYKVGGVLQNAWNTSSAIDSINPFSNITPGTIPSLDFKTQRDIPGFNWKDVTVDITGGGTATYNVKTHYNYVIRTAQGNYFRLRFLSYTLDGRSGFPRFEYSLLE